jgi:hypothetical protein
MGARVESVDVDALRVQGVGDDFVRTALIPDSVKNYDYAISGNTCGGWPIAIKEAGFVLGRKYSVVVPN